MKIELLCRYPVKSLLGEEIPRAEVTERGLAGDRALALLDLATGKVASAKYPSRWRKLLQLSTATGADGVEITGPEGLRLHAVDVSDASDASDVSVALSRLFGREVALIAEPPVQGELDRAVPEEVLAAGPTADVPYTVSRFGQGAPTGTFFDFAPVHLITTATLGRTGVAWQRYRPNLVIRTDEADGYAENDWLDRELLIGSHVRLRVTASTPRCAVPTLAHGELPPDPEALRVVSRENRTVPLPGAAALPCAGVYAQVVRPGRIELGDSVRFG
ncbi:MOSC domain-containing protein [Streptomyces camelliae]|uniref:MOSC domain-containing protein n=1 Tax=Streptomyces camelliae TaxID=3004093 RepID=A0ABY7NU59_9ACTN|nr:MOSC N-terminal beta barrel domain-containing protein [Streptomyces sp. HUAS 2-6]WBO61779.1 MOSC domain-containing protein [Streptomyces sp. HUAS 2-6]